MSTRDSRGGKGGRCVRLTTYHPCSAQRQEIRGLNLPGPPWAISTAFCGRDLYLYLLLPEYGLICTEEVTGAFGVVVLQRMTLGRLPVIFVCRHINWSIDLLSLMK